MISVRRKFPPILVLVVLASLFWVVTNLGGNPGGAPKLSTRTVDTPRLERTETQAFEFKPRKLNQAELQSISSHAIFSPSRKPFKREPEEIAEKPVVKPEIIATPAPEPLVPLPNIRYSGIIESDGDVRALIEDVDSGEQKWLGLGDKIGDWNITVINNLQVVLRLEQREHFVDMLR